MADFYDILGVDRNASENDIKKAYKKAAAKWHPDRYSSKGDKERQEAENKFKEINEAYQILSDPQKKAQYDRFGTVEGMGGPRGGGGFSGFPDMDDIFNMFAGRGGRRSGNGATVQPGNNAQHEVGLGIEEVFKGCTKEVEYYVDVRCPECGGEGGTGVEVCPYCHGTGMVTELKQTGFMTMQTSHPCEHCHGKGKIVKNKCNQCHGTGFTKEKRKVSVQFPAGFTHGQFIKFTGRGSEAKDKRGQNGDLFVVGLYAFDTNKYKIVGNNVYELIDVPYYDCILGATYEMTLPSGIKKQVSIPKHSQDGALITLRGCGINGGNYIYVVKATLPTICGIEETELLKNIKKLHG